MDITGDREREQRAQTAPQPERAPARSLTRAELDRAIIMRPAAPVLKFTHEQAGIIALTEHHIQEAMQTLDALSRAANLPDGASYGPPSDIERVALLNGIANLLIEKGILTMEEVFVAKREAIAEQIDAVVTQARSDAAVRARPASRLITPRDHRGAGGASRNGR